MSKLGPKGFCGPCSRSWSVFIGMNLTNGNLLKNKTNKNKQKMNLKS